MRQPVVLFDVDGVIANWTQAALDKVAKFTGIPRFDENDVDLYDIGKWLEDKYPGSDLSKRMYELVQHPEHHLTCISPYPMATVVMPKIRELAEVHYVTTPMPNCRTWHWERTTWLATHFGAHHTDVTVTYKKHHVKGDLFFDDKIKNVEDWQRAHPMGRAFVWDRPYNRQATHLPRVMDMADAHSEVVKFIRGE